MTGWFVVHTHARAEEQAAGHLARQGFTPYLPRIGRTIRHAGRISKTTAPLFPRYLFVALDLEAQRWRAVKSTVGIAGLVSLGEWPTPIDDAVIHEIRDREGEDGLIVLTERPRFQAGQPVMVTQGACRSLDGLFVAEAGDERVIVMLSLLGRTLRVTLPAASVVACA
ncbi:transcriptional activator RfaH [Paramagnetospirillum kuznetsovii]|uniref:Transcriptional activator RfaH n=1 Tax=Paramagnetospirillum kuznetsovii TaxID=2053833 RepID=A0A364P2I8_9PROT|nr:transcriptional activator RfaH [Paramagnetospirillum kuznetsovii]RAU23543.1 transcriptional activator RfaH [Paramagnetospirillum kuznetsovii]